MVGVYQRNWSALHCKDSILWSDLWDGVVDISAGTCQNQPPRTFPKGFFGGVIVNQSCPPATNQDGGAWVGINESNKAPSTVAPSDVWRSKYPLFIRKLNPLPKLSVLWYAKRLIDELRCDRESLKGALHLWKTKTALIGQQAVSALQHEHGIQFQMFNRVYSA